jgi:hypothetical protein
MDEPNANIAKRQQNREEQQFLEIETILNYNFNDYSYKLIVYTFLNKVKLYLVVTNVIE